MKDIQNGLSPQEMLDKSHKKMLEEIEERRKEKEFQITIEKATTEAVKKAVEDMLSPLTKFLKGGK